MPWREGGQTPMEGGRGDTYGGREGGRGRDNCVSTLHSTYNFFLNIEGKHKLGDG